MKKVYLGDKLLSTELKLGEGYVFVPFEENYNLPTASAVLRYDFGDTNSYPGTGTTINDLQGNFDGGIITAGPSGSFSPTDFEGSWDFDGTSKIQFPVSSSAGTGEWSMTTWVKVPSSPSPAVQCILHSNGEGGSQPKVLLYRSGEIFARFTAGGDETQRFQFGFDTGSMKDEWHQITVVRDVNGGVSASVDLQPLVAGGYEDTGSAQWGYIGIDDLTPDPEPYDVNNWQGSISNLSLYDKKLTKDEINSVYYYYDDRL